MIFANANIKLNMMDFMVPAMLVSSLWFVSTEFFILDRGRKKNKSSYTKKLFANHVAHCISVYKLLGFLIILKKASVFTMDVKKQLL